MTTPFPFTAGQVLTAAQMNDITNLPINDQTASYTLVVGDAGKRVVMDVATANTVTVDDSVFTTGDTIFIANKGAGASTLTAGAGVTINSASGLALVTSQSGQLVALSASSFLFVASDVTASAGAVVQVKSTTKTDTFSMSSATFTDVTGLSVSITPTSASNKILVVASLTTGNDISNSLFQRLMRDSTAIAVGDTAGSRTPVTAFAYVAIAGHMQSSSLSVLDSPATTSAVTYKIQIRSGGAAVAMLVNRSESDTDSATIARAVSTITVFEVTP